MKIRRVGVVGMTGFMGIGPLALLDFNGIDTILNVANAMYRELKDPIYAVPILMRKMVANGWLGRKTGKGFYDYD